MLHTDIKAAIPAAMKAKDQLTLDTLRMLATAFTNELVATKRKPDEFLTDDEALAVMRREVKKRKEAAEAFDRGGRVDAADKERAEQKILESYLPAMIAEDELKKIVEAKKAELNVTDKKDAGRLMGAVMKAAGGRADGQTVKALVDATFQQR